MCPTGTGPALPNTTKSIPNPSLRSAFQILDADGMEKSATTTSGHPTAGSRVRADPTRT
ncbi:hypothetical protein CASFOL_038960 [Castilleja foliolosa]|uniref:Uncharacterized protein n=1 Tax=Castilleja foliolosa TaxID=1961234 RepID=A0ABD3BIE2_9LAMI